jgi:hypothetical protein
VTVVLWSMLFVVADGGGGVDCGNGDCRVHGGVILPLLVHRRLSFKQPGHLSRDARCSPQNTVSRKSRRFQIRCAP